MLPPGDDFLVDDDNDEINLTDDDTNDDLTT